MKRRVIKVNAISFAKLCALMIEGTRTKQELADETGLHYLTVCQYTRELHRAGAAYIIQWEKDSRGRDSMPVLCLGVGRDAKRARMTAAQRQARYRSKTNSIDMINILGRAL